LHFNIIGPKEAAAIAIRKDTSTVQSFCKIGEGGFNRVFEITIDDQSLIARLPYSTTYPKHFTIASEVATINLVRSYGIPAPKILDFSATSYNAVGSEYILVEKANGRDLGVIWYEISEKERLKVLSQVGKLEKVLFSIELPAYGSIYHKSDLGFGTQSVDFIGGNEGAGKFSVGPDVAQKWWYEGRGELPVSCGPCKDITSPFQIVLVMLIYLQSHDQTKPSQLVR
jgi:hypothetical protein